MYSRDNNFLEAASLQTFIKAHIQFTEREELFLERAYYLTSMIKDGIIPAENKDGNTFTIEDFNKTEQHIRAASMILETSTPETIKGITDFAIEKTLKIKTYTEFCFFLSKMTRFWFKLDIASCNAFGIQPLKRLPEDN